MDGKPLRQILAARLKQWMKDSPGLDTQVKVAERSGLAQSSIGRILSASNDARLDIIEVIAKAFDRHPAELLLPVGMDIALRKLCALPESERAKIAAFIDFTLAQHKQGGMTETERLSFSEEHPAPAPMQQAMRRAAGRPVTAVQEEDRDKKRKRGKDSPVPRKLGGNKRT